MTHESTPTDQTFTIAGMTCAHCEASVREEVEELAGVESAAVDHSTGVLRVLGTVAPSAVREAVAEAGYRVV